MSTGEKYRATIEAYKEISLLGTIIGHLNWDHQVYLPPKGLAVRTDQLAYLESMAHRKLTDPRLAEGVRELAGLTDELGPDERVNVREIRREVDRATKIPVELVEELSRHTSQAQMAWVEARKNKDFAAFAPYLKKTVALQLREAEAVGYPEKPYDAMLDKFEPGANEKQIDALLTDLRERLVPFLHQILGAPGYDAGAIAGKKYPIDAQRDFGQAVLRQIGFDFEGGRQDIAAHPFCTGIRGDVRITTRFFETDPRPSLMAMIHEGGHGLYEQGLPEEHQFLPRGESVSLGVHESQSRFFENVVGRSLPFWKYFAPKFRAAFPAQLDGLSPEELHRCFNVVAPSLIRVEADEATYNLHIVLRFEIERDLAAGRVAVDDLPAVWNAKMKEYLDVTVPDDAVGVLQDIHWSISSLGYFPTYTIGNLYAAQLWQTVRRDLPDVEAMIERGEFAPLVGWMREKIHRHGKTFRGPELIERATGEAPSAVPFMNYLQEKFAPLYGL